MNKKYFAIASLVLGIIAVIGTFIAADATEYLFGFVGIICGILGIKSEKKNLAIAGIVLSALPFVGFVILYIITYFV